MKSHRVWWESPFPQLRYVENLTDREEEELLRSNTWKRGESLHPSEALTPLAPQSGPHLTKEDDGIQ